jgi:hypothetical protein
MDRAHVTMWRQRGEGTTALISIETEEISVSCHVMQGKHDNVDHELVAHSDGKRAGKGWGKCGAYRGWRRSGGGSGMPVVTQVGKEDMVASEADAPVGEGLTEMGFLGWGGGSRCAPHRFDSKVVVFVVGDHRRFAVDDIYGQNPMSPSRTRTIEGKRGRRGPGGARDYQEGGGVLR